MDQNIATVIMLGALLIVVAIIITALLRYRLQSKILRLGQLDADAIKALGQSFKPQLNSLKWGLTLLFAGLGLIILQYVPYKADTPLPYGVEAVCIAAGLLIYYRITKKD